jgi:GntR family transcriptional regulator
VERLRLADGAPVILERRFVVESLCPGLHQRDFGASLYGIWTDRYKLEIAGADQTIRAAPIRGREARLLEVSGGAAGLVVRSVGWLRDGKPLWWEQTIYRGDAYAFRNRLGPVQTARPAAGLFVGDAEEDF